MTRESDDVTVFIAEKAQHALAVLWTRVNELTDPFDSSAAGLDEPAREKVLRTLADIAATPWAILETLTLKDDGPVHEVSAAAPAARREFLRLAGLPDITPQTTTEDGHVPLPTTIETRAGRAQA